MEAFAPESPRLELLGPARYNTPPTMRHVLPLRIVKRSDSGSVKSSLDMGHHVPRHCSHGTDESRGSAPEPHGGDRQLTVPKIRGHRHSHMFESLDDLDGTPEPLDRQRYASKDLYTSHLEHKGYDASVRGGVPSDLRHGHSGRNAHAVSSFQSRNPTRPREEEFKNSTVGLRDPFAFWNSQQAKHNGPRPFPRAMEIGQRSHTADSFPHREPSLLTLRTHETASDDPHFPSNYQKQRYLEPGALVVPSVRFVPDARVVDSGYHNFWVAIEVSARLNRHGPHVPTDSSQGTTPLSGSSTTCSSEIGEQSLSSYGYCIVVDKR